MDLAVVAARRAFHRNSEWRLMDASQRGAIIHKISELLLRDSQYLAELESYNNGLVLSYSERNIRSAANLTRYIASCSDKIHGDTLAAGNSNKSVDILLKEQRV